MLLVSLAGSLAGIVRATVLDGAGRWNLTLWVLPLLGPVAVVAALAVWVGRRSPAAGWWGGIAAALVAAVYNFEALHPEYNEDANIGMGIHIMLGWLFPLGPAFLVGAGLGLLVERQRGLPPSPAALENARPLPPLRPWLWPLVVPAVAVAAVQFTPLLPGRVGVYREELLRFVLVQSVFLVGTLPVALSPALIALLILRSRAARDGVTRPRIAAFWGLCLGLGMTLGLFGFGLRLLPGLSLELTLGLSVLPPVLGYGLGRWLGSGRRHKQRGG